MAAVERILNSDEYRSPAFRAESLEQGPDGEIVTLGPDGADKGVVTATG